MTRRMLASSIAMAMGLSSLVAAGTAHAIPSTLTVQGYLTNNAGVASDGNYTITVSLWNAETAGTRLFTQTITGVQVSGGLFDVALGNDILYPGLGPDIFKNNNNVYVQVQLEAGPGVVANEAPLPRQALAVSPFAYASHYATSAASATTANTATTATTSNGLVCSTGCVSISELDFDPATQAELDAALVNLVTTAGLNTTLADYAKKSELSGYVTSNALTTALAAYVTSNALNTTLGGYVTSNALNTALGSYATTASLSNYATTASLSNYVTSAGLATTLGSYVTSATLGTTLGSYATTAALSNYVTTTNLTATLADYAKKTDLPTSVNNLAGGTITSNTTVSGELAATSLKQNGKAVCDESGNCGATLSSLAPCTDGQVASFVGGSWKCADAAAGGTPPSSCTGNFKALQWNGSAWVCTDIRTTGLSAGKANGFEVVDDWGWAWDGTQRGAKTYSEAKTLCEGLGARLPLVTELWRNNATSGTGNLGDVGATSYLWTQVPYSSAADYYLIRLSDGTTSNATDNTSAKYSFRCVWPDYSSTVFDGDNCNGAPGAACVPYGTVWNVDAADRAPMWYNSAQYECNFNNGSLLEPYQFHDLSQTGTWGNGTANWLWSADVIDWYQSYHGFILYQFTNNGRVNWLSDDNDLGGNYSGRNEVSYSQNYGGQYRFRCIGRKATNIGKAPANPGCNGGCYTLAKAGRRLYFDKTSRDALNHAQATETCRVVGAALPKINEFTEAVHAGWTDSDNSYLWIDEPVYYYQGRSYYPIAGRWNTANANDAGFRQGWRWSPEGNTNQSRRTLETQGEDNLFKFRCVWRDTIETTFTNCAANQIQTWDGTAYSCSNATSGTSNGQAIPNGIQIVDAWGNAWDTFQRNAATYANAKTTCETAGGRLPTATEIYRVRANQTMAGVSAIGDSTSTSYLWTMLPDNLDNTYVTIRVSDGAGSRLAATSTTPFRCVWPTTKGDAFTGRSCYGDPTAPCFTTGRVRMDKNDRAPVSVVAAFHECRFYGGRLAGTEDYMTAIHAGLPNGSQNDLWSSNTANWYNDGRGYMTVRWNGTGTAGFTYQNNTYRTLNVYYGYSYIPFRCVFTDEIR